MFTNLHRIDDVTVQMPIEVLREEVKYTPADYLPPEVVSGQILADKQTDIFSLGTAFFSLLAGKKLSEVKFRNAGDLLAHMVLRNPRYPKQLAQIVFRAIHPDRAKRYARVEDMIADLKAFRWWKW